MPSPGQFSIFREGGEGVNWGSQSAKSWPNLNFREGEVEGGGNSGPDPRRG